MTAMMYWYLEKGLKDGRQRIRNRTRNGTGVRWRKTCRNWSHQMPSVTSSRVEILIDNAHRPGVIANLTLSEFAAAMKEEDMYTIRVHDHIEKVRPQAQDSDDGPESLVFITFNGNGMT